MRLFRTSAVSCVYSISGSRDQDRARCTSDLVRSRPFSSATSPSTSSCSSSSLPPPSHPDPPLSRHRSLVTLIPLDLQPPPPGSNKSAPLHVPAPNPLSIPPAPFPFPQIDAPAPRCRHSTAIHPRTRACVSPRFALLDHVRMSSPTALTRFTLESLLCRGTRRRNTRAYSVSRNY